MGTPYTFDEGIRCNATRIELFYFDENFPRYSLWVRPFMQCFLHVRYHVKLIVGPLRIRQLMVEILNNQDQNIQHVLRHCMSSEDTIITTLWYMARALSLRRGLSKQNDLTIALSHFSQRQSRHYPNSLKIKVLRFG